MHWLKLAKLLWASPCSALGLVLAAFPLAAGGTAKWSGGALEVTYRDTKGRCGKLAPASCHFAASSLAMSSWQSHEKNSQSLGLMSESM